MVDYAQKACKGNGVEFHALGFFDEHNVIFAQARYDVIFFQESVPFLNPLDAVMGKSRQLLKDNGFLIIADEVCYDESIKHGESIHTSSDFVVALAEHGFRITQHEKIGKNVSPTYEVIIEGLARYKRDIIASGVAEEAGDRVDFYISLWGKKKKRNLEGQIGYEIFVGKKDNFFVKPYSIGDEKNILSTFGDVFRVERSIEHWFWKYRDNPFDSYKISEVFSDDGNLVAHYSGYPVFFYDHTNDSAETFLSIQIGDTMTRPEVRGVGRGKTSILARSAQHFYAKYCEGKVPFTYGFNTGTIKKFGEKFLRYQYIDAIPYRVKNVKGFSPYRISSFKKILCGYTVEMINSFDRNFDYFFERTAPHYVLLVKRDSKYLAWRYRNCPDKNYICVAAYKRKEIIGWSIFYKKGVQLLWGDALFDRNHGKAVQLVLNFLFQSSLFRDIETIEGWFSKNPQWWNDILDQAGFDLTNEPNNLFPGFYTLTEDETMMRLQNSFYYTMGDSDLF